MFSDEVLLVTDFVNHHHQHFLVNIDSGYIVRHDLLPAWKGRTCGIEVKLSHALLPFPLGRAATHLWVQNAHSGPYSVTAQLIQSAGDLHHSTSGTWYTCRLARFSSNWVGRRPMDTPSKVARSSFVFSGVIGCDSHAYWWAEGPCNTPRNDRAVGCDFRPKAIHSA